MNIKSSEVNISAMKIGSDYILVNLHIFDISNRYYEVFSETGNTYASDVIFTCTALHWTVTRLSIGTLEYPHT